MGNEYESLAARVKYCIDAFGEAKPFRLPQEGNLDLAFEGWEISAVDDSALRPDRATVDVCTFYTKRGSYVVELVRHVPNRAGPEHPHLTRVKAAAFANAPELLQWLIADGRGWLGENSKQAWEGLCGKLPWLAERMTIQV